MDKSNGLVAGVLGCDPADLPSDATELKQLRGWDSLRHVLLVVGLEKHLGRKLTAVEIRQIVTLGDVTRLIAQK